MAQEVGGVGDIGSGDITKADVQAHIEAFLNMALRSAHFIDE
jgi:hypothetical protein